MTETRSFEVLPARYAEWQADHRTPLPPSRWSPFCPANGHAKGALVVTYPRKDEVFLIEPGYDAAHQTLELALEIDPPVPAIEWRVDGKAIASAEWPYKAAWPLARGKHEIRAVVPGERESAGVPIEVR
jgi:hypothetical protein